MSDRKSRRLSRMYLEGEEQETKTVEKKAAPKDDFIAPPRIGYEDMTKMEDMTLEAVLKNLQERYEQNQIYVCVHLACHCELYSLSKRMFSLCLDCLCCLSCLSCCLSVLSSNPSFSLFVHYLNRPTCRRTLLRFLSPSILSSDCKSTALDGSSTTRASASVWLLHTFMPSLRLHTMPWLSTRRINQCLSGESASESVDEW
jgi:hypothetical protein